MVKKIKYDVAKYEKLSNTELIKIIVKSKSRINELEEYCVLFEEGPNRNIELYINNLAVEVGVLFKLDIAQKVLLVEAIRGTVNSFIK